MSDKGGSDYFKGLIIGGVIGAVIALLYAPKSGKETREELSKKKDELLDRVKEDFENTIDKAHKSIAEAQKKLNELGKAAKEKADKVSDLVEQTVEKGKTDVVSQKGKIKEAVIAAKEAYNEEKGKKKKA